MSRFKCKLIRLPFLSGSKLIKYFNQASQQLLSSQYQFLMQPSLSLFQGQVSGKLPKYTSEDQMYIYKKLSKEEHSFYVKMQKLRYTDSAYQLLKFLPEYAGTIELEIKQTQPVSFDSPEKNSNQKIEEWMNLMAKRESEVGKKQQFIILKNLTFQFKHPCLMDVKLGRKLIKKQSNKKFADSTTNSHHFRINGMKKYDIVSQENEFIDKYYFQKTTHSQIQAHLAFFFYDGQRIDTALIKSCISVIKALTLHLLGFRAGRLSSSSLLIGYDGDDHSKFFVKLIDFDKFMAEEGCDPDMNIIQGLKYIVTFLDSAIENEEKHVNAIEQKSLGFLEEKEVISIEKIVGEEGV